MPNAKLFPVVNISYLASEYVTGKKQKDTFHEDPIIKSLAKEIENAFMEWGFVYFVGHGIDQDIINKAFQNSKVFFELDETIKESFRWRSDDNENFGWIPFKGETFKKSHPHDLKECFNFLPMSIRENEVNKLLPDFMNCQRNLLTSCENLSQYILRLLMLTLPLNKLEFLNTRHSFTNHNLNASIIRLLYYPPIKYKKNVIENQLRCGEHSDYGTITFLFQDQAGGLQVVNPSGDYVDVTPVPGSIVVNVGDLLEIWSAGKFKSTQHRVIVPESISTARQSIAYFVYPDSNIMVSCLDGSNKYEAVNPLEYLTNKYKATYA